MVDGHLWALESQWTDGFRAYALNLPNPTLELPVVIDGAGPQQVTPAYLPVARPRGVGH